MQSVDTIVIGAGIAGASVAWQLVQDKAGGEGASVLLLERESQPGYHTTGRSAALYSATYGTPNIRALTRASRDFYLHPPPGFADQPLLAPRQALFVATPAQHASLDAMQAELEATGTQLSLLNKEQLALVAPALKPDLFDGALLDTDGYDIDVDTLLQGFLRGARQAGTRVLTSAVPTQAERVGDAWHVALSNAETVQARTVVNAAGAWADEVATLFGAAPIGLEPRRRSAFTFRAPEGVDVSNWPMVADVDEGWYIKVDAGQLLGSPANADPVEPHDVQPEELDIAMGIHAIQEATTLEIRRPTATWAGLRSFVRDGEIVIGFDDAVPQFFWLAAQGGYGIQSAAGASLLAASLIEGCALPDELVRHGVDPAAVSPARLR